MEGCYELAFITGAALIDAEEWEAAETRLKEAQGTRIIRSEGMHGCSIGLGKGGRTRSHIDCLMGGSCHNHRYSRRHLQTAGGRGAAGCAGAAQRSGRYPPRGQGGLIGTEGGTVGLHDQNHMYAHASNFRPHPDITAGVRAGGPGQALGGL